MTIREIYDYLDEIAPFANQSGSDNSGLIVGDYDMPVKKILVCLDVINDVVREAAEKGVDLIIAHHPLMYRPISKISLNDPLHTLIRNKINLIAIHTNIDVAFGGVSDLMLKKLGFPQSNKAIIPINSEGLGYGRIIELNSPISAEDLAEKSKNAFNCTIVKYVDSGKPITKIGVSSGSAAESVEEALHAGCDAFICGEVKYDRMLFAKDHGLTLIEAGHFHTEDVYCEDLVDRLKTKFTGIEIEKAKNSIDVCDYVT
ncbi:MAG: Nif3-like dinuclear metal center hexameric protein [Oscillospiraceae bacterium]|nr:Nif3-like dinuclear metal center hexameric protein [Oscillospiraceae bacterium]